MNAEAEWKWCGAAHHFCAADSCRFHLATFIGDYLVSTVGDYYRGDDRTTLGWADDSYFESFVFDTDGDHGHVEGHPKVVSFTEIEGERCATHEAANEVHLRFCHKYAALAGLSLTHSDGVSNSPDM